MEGGRNTRFLTIILILTSSGVAYLSPNFSEIKASDAPDSPVAYEEGIAYGISVAYTYPHHTMSANSSQKVTHIVDCEQIEADNLAGCDYTQATCERVQNTCFSALILSFLCIVFTALFVNTMHQQTMGK